MGRSFLIASLGTHGPWVLLDGFPLLLNVFVWCLAVTVMIWPNLLRADQASASGGRLLSKSARQTKAYKRWGAVLLVVGAAGGFLPSLTLLVGSGYVWSVNRVGPHDEVDAALMVHIPFAVLWALAMAYQLWSGGNGTMKKSHRVVGWIAVGCGLFGLSIAAGWVWTYLNDFREGLSDPRAGAGIYTIGLGLGVAVNTVMLVVTARKRNFLAHKDHALMALFWSLDPGVHRAIMWTMRMFHWECWAPENTGGMGIALAKLPANLFLILWALSMASRAGRMNRIILSNVAGQLLLFLYSSHGLMTRSFGMPISTTVVSVTIGLSLIAVGMLRARGPLAAAN